MSDVANTAERREDLAYSYTENLRERDALMAGQSLVRFDHGIRLAFYAGWDARGPQNEMELIAERDAVWDENRRLTEQNERLRIMAELGTVKELREEVACLRSVLSEWDYDKTCFVQWTRAEEIRAFKNSRLAAEQPASEG